MNTTVTYICTATKKLEKRNQFIKGEYLKCLFSPLSTQYLNTTILNINKVTQKLSSQVDKRDI